jgi:hypothetical protein
VERCPYQRGGVASSRDETLNFFLIPEIRYPKNKNENKGRLRSSPAIVSTTPSVEYVFLSLRFQSSYPFPPSLPPFSFLGFYGVLGTVVGLTEHPETFLFSLITRYRLTAKYVPLPCHSAHSGKLPPTLTAMATAAKTLSRALPRSSATSSARLATRYASRPIITQQFFHSSRRNYSSGPAPSSSSKTGLYIGAAAVAVTWCGRILVHQQCRS